MDGESESLALRIRMFFRDLLGSRMTAHLGEELLRLRTDFEQRLQEKDLIVASLREEKALLMSKVTMYELTIMPHASRVGAEVVAYQKPTKPSFSFIDIPAPKSRWQMVQDEHDAQMAKEIEEDKVKAATAAAKE
jgi:hypothetical protein